MDRKDLRTPLGGKVRRSTGSESADMLTPGNTKAPTGQHVLRSENTSRLFIPPADVRPDPDQLLFDTLVTPIDVIHALYAGRALGDQAGENQRRGRA